MSKKGIAMIVGLILILIVGFFLLKGVVEQAALPSECGNSVLLSIDKIDYTTSSNLNNRQIIRVYTVAGNNGAECFRIQFDKAQIEQKLEQQYGGNFVVDNTVYGDFSKVKQTQTYTAIKQLANVYKRAQLVNSGFNLFCANGIGIQNCKNKGYTNTVWSVPKGTDCYCVNMYNFAEDGTFAATSLQDFKVDFRIDGLGSATINSADARSAVIRDSTGTVKAYVQWVGYLLSNQWLSNPNYDPMFFYNTNSFRLVQDQSYSIYNTLYTKYSGLDFWRLENHLLSNGYDWVVAEVASYNSQVDNIVLNKLDEYKQFNPSVETVNYAGANMVVELSKNLLYPTFIVELDAAFVGVHKVEGMPELDCSNLDDFTVNSGDVKKQSFILKNGAPVGSGSAGFNLGVTCNNGGSATLEKYSTSIAAQATDNIDVFSSILVSSPGTKTSSCTIRAVDVKSLQEDTCGYTFTGQYVQGCTQDICDGGDLMKCNNDGSTTRQDCSYGCIYRTGVAECAAQPREICTDSIDNDNDGLVDANDPECQGEGCGNWIDTDPIIIAGQQILPEIKVPNYWCIFTHWLGSIINAIAIGLGIIMALLSVILGRGIIEKYGLKQDALTWGALIVISLILGALVWYITTLYWWVGLIILIIGVIIKIVL